MISKLAKNLAEITATAVDFGILRYPGFVYGAGLADDVVPVFCFHEVQPEPFDEMLAYLDSNGYTTLHADEYYNALTGRSTLPAKSVMLTFDDGWGSLRSVGFPILRRYGAKIVVFLASGRIEHQAQRWPDLDDLQRGDCSLEVVLRRDESDQPLLSWEEILEMHGSGLVDFQSHSHNHTLIYRSPRIVDFVNPEMLASCNLMELPCAVWDRPITRKADTRLGEPLYETSPRLSDVPALLVNSRVADRCIEYVNENGGMEFFRSRRWRQELSGMTDRLLEKTAYGWRRETPEMHRRAVRYELEESKRRIEEMLPGKVVRHLCYPWHEAGRMARDLAAEVGYVAGFWGKIGSGYYTRMPGDPHRIARLGSDFFFRLPGRGRIGLLPIFTRKMGRRAREGSPYLTH